MPRPPSDIWNHFTTYDDPGSRIKRARCHYCDHQQASSITRLYRHLTRICPHVPDVVRQELSSRNLGKGKHHPPFVTYETNTTADLDDALQVLARASYNLPSTQVSSSASRVVVSPGNLDVSHQATLDWSLARALFAADVPFKTIENPHFVQFLNRLNPNYKPPSQRQLQQLLLKREHWDILADKRTTTKDCADDDSTDSETESGPVHMEA
ncbi:hypothetical protein K450DRAFT_256899 [Umbelopsis ramanniana AG]|uniref:BED-type domain-containing protein n=1 Tax=Umbelopsis ramanniana AG TaxID=1314678 RepID=A0AAD5E6C6_UMBRA|nr:uncharacterized protein K450DRAFT_256899 [Umbelopsis ramanniana AG]KAI8576475.1 hypothetical protein K450DRAFT_256899 [Umbelopsis ramanniana AG]